MNVSQRTRPVDPAQGSQRARRYRRRVRFDAPPPRALALSGWALVPLRAFLGITFLFAGVQKLANPNFFNANSPSSIQAQLIASIRISPLHELLGHLLRFAVPIGIVIALAELAVGLGTILGLWTRVAAAGGMVLAFTLFLTVSFHSSPYYTGADIVFVFAWIPLVLAGSGGVLSLDGVIAARVAGEYDLGPPTVVPIRFALVQQVCGHYDNDSCTAKSGRRCDVHGCPFLSADPIWPAAPWWRGGLDEIERRTFVLGGAAAVAAAVAGGVVAGAAAGLGRAVGGAKSPGTRASRSGPPTTSRRLPRAPARRRPLQSRPRPRLPRRGLRLAWPARYRSAEPRASLTPKRETQVWSSNSPRADLSPTTPSAPMPGARWGIPPPPTSSCARVTAPNSIRATGAVVSPPASHGLSSIQVAVAANGDLVVDG